MTRGAAGGREAGLEALKEDEGGESDSLMEFGAMKGICYEKGELGLGMRRGRRVLGTGEKMGDEKSWCDILVAVKGVRFRGGVDRNGWRGRLQRPISWQ